MKISEVKKALEKIQEVKFKLPNGVLVAEHFHVTEVGQITKHFIDCGGTERKEKVINFQLWEANDFDHRLKPQKLNDIISLSEKVLGLEDLDVEVEYQSDTIGKYDLNFDGTYFILTAKQTNCLATDKCGVPVQKLKVSLSNLSTNKNACSPETGCCG